MLEAEGRGNLAREKCHFLPFLLEFNRINLLFWPPHLCWGNDQYLPLLPLVPGDRQLEDVLKALFGFCNWEEMVGFSSFSVAHDKPFKVMFKISKDIAKKLVLFLTEKWGGL